MYGIAYGQPRPRDQLVEAAKGISRKLLIGAANKHNQYGMGFLGVHASRGANFVFLGYWADENELHHTTSTCRHLKSQLLWKTLRVRGDLPRWRRRWVVGCTCSWLGQNRRMSKDYERLPGGSEAFVYVAMSRF